MEVWYGFVVFNATFNNMYLSYIVAFSFIDGRNGSTQRKPPTCRKLLTNYFNNKKKLHKTEIIKLSLHHITF